MISQAVLEKLENKHGVTPGEVLECFANRMGGHLRDLREEHQTDPATLWFVSETDAGRLPKIMVISVPKVLS